VDGELEEQQQDTEVKQFHMDGELYFIVYEEAKVSIKDATGNRCI